MLLPLLRTPKSEHLDHAVMTLLRCINIPPSEYICWILSSIYKFPILAKSTYSKISVDITQKFHKNEVFKVLERDIPEAWILLNAVSSLVGENGKLTDGVKG